MILGAIDSLGVWCGTIGVYLFKEFFMVDINKFTDGRFTRGRPYVPVRGPGVLRRFVRHLRDRA